MRSPDGTPTDGRVGASGSIFDVPLALWTYALLRPLAFLAPALTADGSIGLGVLVVAVLFVFVLRRSRRAYQALVLLDIFSGVMLMTAWVEADDNPLSIPILAGLSLMALLWPSNWRYVSAPTTHQPSTDRFTDHSTGRALKGY